MAGDHYFLELEPPEERLRHAPHVVIVGGGFAGIQACRALAKSEVRITLIDKRNFNLFQPLHYQVAQGCCERRHRNTPARARGKATKRANPARRSHRIDPR